MRLIPNKSAVKSHTIVITLSLQQYYHSFASQMSVHPLSPPPRRHYDPPASPTGTSSGRQRSVDATKHPPLNGHTNLQTRLTAVETELKDLNKTVSKKLDSLKQDISGQNGNPPSRNVKRAENLGPLGKVEDQNEEILGKTDMLEARILKVEDLVLEFREQFNAQMQRTVQKGEADGKSYHVALDTAKSGVQDDIAKLSEKVYTLEDKMHEQFSLMNANFAELFRRLDGRGEFSLPTMPPLPIGKSTISSPPSTATSTTSISPSISTSTSTSTSTAPSMTTISTTTLQTSTTPSASVVTIVALPNPSTLDSAVSDTTLGQPVEQTVEVSANTTEPTTNLAEDLVEQFDARLQHVQGSLEQTQSSVKALSGLVTLLRHAKSKMSLKTSKSKRRNRD